MQLIPWRAGLPCHKEIQLPVLLLLQPAVPQTLHARPHIDLALVIDRSSSMNGEPIRAAKAAASAAVASLMPTDRVCVVQYDNEVNVVVQLQLLAEKTPILGLINQIYPRGTTALFDGWAAGARQLAQSDDRTRMKRVMLLTDGEANVGLLDPDEIGKKVSEAAQTGVLTSTLGFGQHYNENLLRAMAASGNGNHYFVENPGQLMEVFNLELAGLEATVGTTVRLRAESPMPGAKTQLLQEFREPSPGLYEMPDLVGGCPIWVRFNVTVPALPSDSIGQTVEVARFTVSWTVPKEGTLEQKEFHLSLPVLSIEDWEKLPQDAQVNEQMAIYAASVAQQDATRALSLGDPQQAIQALEQALGKLRQQSQSHEGQELAKRLEDQLDNVKKRDYSAASKKMTQDSYSSFSSRTSVTLGYGLGRRIRRLTETLGLINNGSLPSRWDEEAVNLMGHPMTEYKLPVVDPLRERYMLIGIAVGDALGTTSEGLKPEERRRRFGEIRSYVSDKGLPGCDTQMTFWALDARAKLQDFTVADMSKAFFRGELYGASDSLKQALKNIESGMSWWECGLPSCGNGALPRVAALIPALAQNPGMLGIDALQFTALTHRDEAALASSVSFARMLLDLLRMDGPPTAAWWWERFAEVCAALEKGQKYGAAGDFEGKLSEFVLQELPQAYSQGLSVLHACQKWGSGAYLFETVPSALYILARHATEPEEAMVRAVNDTVDNDTIAAVVGAALGALHGKAAFPESWLKQHTFRTQADDDGEILRILDRAL